MKTFNASISENLEQGRAVVQVTIIEQHGSAPRTAGAKMLVMPDTSSGASVVGTVGGGLYEGKAIELAQELFLANNTNTTQDPNQALLVYFDLHGNNFPTDMDMICGGELRLLLEYIPVTEETRALYNAVVQAEASGQTCALITRINTKSNVDDPHKVLTDKSIYALEDLDPMNFNTQILPDAVKEHAKNIEGKQTCSFVTNEYEYMLEMFHKPYVIHIFGAGHVSCELAKITYYVDFKTIAIDDRAEFANEERFPHATPLVLKSLDYDEITQYFKKHEMDSHDGIVIVTRGHARDRDVLAASLKTDAGYIGMIGSKSKRQITYNFLLDNGYTKESFERIHSPIGLTIGAQTPQEIAVSIVAELVLWRFNHSRGCF